MQILWLFAFLLSEAGDPPSDFRPHKKEQNREVTNISNQPIIFNITYTPWKLKNIRELKRITFPKSIVSESEVRKALLALAKTIPKDASFFYSKKDMVPYRKQIDGTVNKLLLYDKRARKADGKFYSRLAKYETEIFSPFAKDIIKGGMFKKEVVEYFDNYKIEPKNITLIRELEEDYKRRQGNIVLRAVKDIKPEIYERKRRYKVNDNGLKRRLAISRYKVGKLISGFLSTFGEESEYLSRDYTNRLKEIEDEIQEETGMREK